MRGALEALGVEQDLRTAIAKSDASEEQRCTNLCNAIAAVLLLLVGVSYVLAAAACGFLILIVPLFILCLISAIADALAKTSVVLGWRDDCYDACLG